MNKSNRFMNSYLLSSLTALALICSALPSIAHEGGHARASVNLSPLSQLRLGAFDQGAAEIVVYHAATQRAYITNSERSSIDVISIAKPEQPSKEFSIDLKPYGLVNSVAVKKGLVAVALANKVKQEKGLVVIFDLEGKHLKSLEVGALPDMLTFTPDGKKLIVANEGEPSSDYKHDPEGSISIIELSSGIEKVSQASIKTARFTQFNDTKLDESVRIFGKGASVSQDVEPEYITISSDSKTAWVSLQENNALAIVDIEKGLITDIVGLGFKSFNSGKNALDASDRDRKINIQQWPVFGLYQPDTIASYSVNGEHFVVTANEGDSRDYEEERIADLSLEPELLKAYPRIKKDKNLGRLKVSTGNADTNGNGKIDRLYAFGARSFSIWNAKGEQVFDSGADFATLIASRYPKLFNGGDKRSDNKGAEPEALTVGQIDDQTYAFIGLERTSGVMAYNITNPKAAYFADYITTVSTKLELDDPKQGDLAPESLVFIGKKDSPNGKALLLSGNEVSGTFSIYQVDATQK